ncbi:MAG: septum formation protein Maf [Planctomycetes bacterium]|nr:septum formation protein Maf [Planctomycetota bacterium]
MSLILREVVLASGSSARKQILEQAGVKFSVIVSNVDEDLHPHDEPEKYVTTLAARKALAVVPRVNKGAIVIAADTICTWRGKIINKPTDENDARKIIAEAVAMKLQRVITGVCVIDTRDMATFSFAETSVVEMKSATAEEIDAYVKTGEPMGKAGALAIESSASFVAKYEGSYANIMGLPIERLLPLLLKLDS